MEFLRILSFLPPKQDQTDQKTFHTPYAGSSREMQHC